MADWTPQSRAEEILFKTINGEPYDGLPQSRIEELLLELKEVIEQGGGGGGGTSDYSQLSNKPSINGSTLIGNKTSADLGLADEYTTITYAQWQAMTDEQRESGKYYVTDVPGYDVPIENIFVPQIFSLSERQVGVWADGKPLYQKSYVFTFNSTASIILDSNITQSVASLISISTSYSRSGDGANVAPFISDQVARMFIDADGVKHEGVGYASWMGTVNGLVTIKYTKTADTVGSGEWTSQGVPAVHYSTDEQVVGTWVDGKTLYQKTIVTNAQVVLSDNSWTAVPFASGDVPSDADIMFCTEWFNPIDSHLICDNRTRFIYDNGAIKGATSQTGGQTVPAGLTLTIRYTKSS